MAKSLKITVVSRKAAAELELLTQLRAHPSFAMFVATLEVDRDEWSTNERNQDEDYPGEARERREAYDLALELLTGTRQPRITESSRHGA